MEISIFIYILAGFGAGFGTGLIGLSAATVIAPMLIGLCGIEPHQAIGIALISDVFASLITTSIYAKEENFVKNNGKTNVNTTLIVLLSSVVFTFVGYKLSTLLTSNRLKGIAEIIPLFVGIKFIIQYFTKKDSKKKEKVEKEKSSLFYWVISILGGLVIGLTSGFAGVGGGLTMLLVLNVFLGYKTQPAVCCSTAIMIFVALIGGYNHIQFDGDLNILCLVVCGLSTCIFAWLTSKYFAKKSHEKIHPLICGILLLCVATISFICKI